MIAELELRDAFRFWGILLCVVAALFLQASIGFSVPLVRDVSFLLLCVAAFFVTGFELLLLIGLVGGFLFSGMIASGAFLGCLVVPLSLFFIRRWFFLQPWVVRGGVFLCSCVAFLICANGVDFVVAQPLLLALWGIVDAVLLTVIFLVWFKSLSTAE